MPISANPTISEINVELGRAANAPFNFNGSEERALAEKPTGAIWLSDFIGKSSWSVNLIDEFLFAGVTDLEGRISFQDGLLHGWGQGSHNVSEQVVTNGDDLFTYKIHSVSADVSTYSVNPSAGSIRSLSTRTVVYLESDEDERGGVFADGARLDATLTLYKNAVKYHDIKLVIDLAGR